MVRRLTDWVQAASALTIAGVTVWVVFFSQVGDLAMQLLQSELSATRQEVQEILEEKEELQSQQLALQEQRDKLARQREKHLQQVVSARLDDLWVYGAKTLRAHWYTATTSQELVELAKEIEPYRNWNATQDGGIEVGYWHRILPMPSEIIIERRTEWGSLQIDSTGIWRCSEDMNHVYAVNDDIVVDIEGTEPLSAERLERINEAQEKRGLEYRRRLVEYHVNCYDELESEIRQRIEVSSSNLAQNIREFSYFLSEWPGLTNTTDEARARITEILTREPGVNSQLANVEIQLRVPKGSSLEEIAKEAIQIQENLEIARDWLDDATRDRLSWAAPDSNTVPTT